MSNQITPDMWWGAIKESLAKEKKTEDLIKCFSHEDMNSKPTEEQAKFLEAVNLPNVNYIYAQCGNRSGKSAAAARLFTWILEETHPTWERPNATYCHKCKSKNYEEVKGGLRRYDCMDCGHRAVDWGDIPISGIISGPSRALIETELWNRKVKPLLTKPEQWRPRKSSGTVMGYENPTNDSVILFMPNGYSIEEARNMCQGFTFQLVWVDEQVSKEVAEELQVRVSSDKGVYIHTFSPKRRDVDPSLVRYINAQYQNGSGIRFNFRTEDNPIYAGRQDEWAMMREGLDKKTRRLMEEGEWLESDNKVYIWNYDTMAIDSLPPDYSPMWPHMEAVDPAAKTKMGYMLFVFDEFNTKWYTVRAEYFEAVGSTTKMCEATMAISRNYNVCWRVSDSNAPWYIEQFHEMYPKEVKYQIPPGKTNSRKVELIKQFQQALEDGWLQVLRDHEDFIREIEDCRFNEAGDKIIKASKYHLLDCAQYFVDVAPKKVDYNHRKSYYERCMEGTAKMRAEKQKPKQQESRLDVIKNFNRGFRVGKYKRGRRR